MPITTYSAQVETIRDLAHEVRQLDFGLREPKGIAFKAGQFVSLELRHPQTGRLETRPYSLASSPGRNDGISLLFNRVPGGLGSTFLFKLAKGDEVRFKGPAGNFYLRDDPGRELLFIATGTGIAPIRSMLLANAERPDPRPAKLFWGLHNQRDTYYQREFDDLARRIQPFTAITTLSAPDPGWPGETGLVLRLIEQRITSVQNLAVYLCGSSAMIADATTLLRKKGLCPIYREQYYENRGHPEV
jgi:NAD(P)H-flavin reductase